MLDIGLIFHGFDDVSHAAGGVGYFEIAGGDSTVEIFDGGCDVEVIFQQGESKTPFGFLEVEVHDLEARQVFQIFRAASIDSRSSVHADFFDHGAHES